MPKTVQDWLKAEVAKAKIARLRMHTCRSGDQLFLLERAQKAEATARILRRVIKMSGVMKEPWQN